MKKSSSVNKNKIDKNNIKDKAIKKINKAKLKIPYNHAPEITEECIKIHNNIIYNKNYIVKKNNNIIIF